MNKFFNFCALIPLLILLGFAWLMWSIGTVFDPGKLYTKTEMIAHYEANRSNFDDAIRIIDQISAPAEISIEFEDGDVEIFHTKLGDQYNSNWPHGKRGLVDSIAQSIGLSPSDLVAIETVIEQAGCIGYNNRRPDSRSFNFARAGMGMYGYVIFTEVLSDSLLNSYNDSCMYVAYNNRIVFEYGGGAIGPQCFGDYFFEE